MCKYCKELNEEKKKIKVFEIEIGYQGYHFWECPINYCPNCGTKLLNK